MNHPASFAVHLKGAQGKMSAQVHAPSGALEECVITELEQGLCVCLCNIQKADEAGVLLLVFIMLKKRNCPHNLGISPSADRVLLLVLQINTPSASSPGRTVSIPSMSNLMALTFQEVPSRFGSGNQDRLETLVWSWCMEPDWKKAQQVG